MKGLYYDTKTNKYFYVGEAICDGEKCELGKAAFHVTIHPNKKASYSQILCHRCLSKAQNTELLIGAEVKMVLLQDMMPEGAFLVPTRRMRFSDSSVFDAATSNKNIKSDASSCTIIDNTRLAGKESLECAQIGMNPAELKDKTEMLDHDEADAFLRDMQNSKPVLPHKDKRLLE